MHTWGVALRRVESTEQICSLPLESATEHSESIVSGKSSWSFCIMPIWIMWICFSFIGL